MSEKDLEFKVIEERGLDNWPTKDMDFYKIKNEEETVSLKWSYNYFEDYKFMARNFFKCGYHIFL